MDVLNQTRYSKIAANEIDFIGDGLDEAKLEVPAEIPRQGKNTRYVVCGLLTAFLGVLVVFWLRPSWVVESECRDTIQHGYQCIPEISRHWGQYSPYFSAPASEFPDEVPEGCEITFANILSRHGARWPTPHKTAIYNQTISKIQSSMPGHTFQGKYAFLGSYEYRLGEAELVEFGEQQMINSGIKFFRRYHHLAADNTPFVRAASKPRVVDSATHWSKGFHTTKKASYEDDSFPYPLIVIEEGEKFNNTLDHSRCDELEHGAYSKLGKHAQQEFMAIFTPLIVDRLNRDLPFTELGARDIINLMQMCPFETVADPQGIPSPFCGLFSTEEFQQLGYYESLDKYYQYSNGNPLGATQGVGFVNELLARMTGKPVEDETSTNTTLDGNDDTFPLGKLLYADFSHDNDLAGIFTAMGLYNNTPPLSKTEIMDEDKTAGFSASWVVPFASRAYFEKMRCRDLKHGEELVRVVINDRVVPLMGCKTDQFGRCTLSDFVDSQSFSRGGGHWDQCYT